MVRLPLWTSGQNSWLYIQRSGYDSRCYQIFWEIIGLERGPLSLVSTTERLLGRKCSGSGLESHEYGRRDPSRWPRGTLYPQKLALTSPTSGSRSVGIVLSRTGATEFSLRGAVSTVQPFAFMMVSSLPYHSTLAVGIRSHEKLTFNRLHGFLSQKI
jgi:hypothetical protein